MNAQLAPIPAPSAPAAISAHILVVDDDQAIREMLTEYLGRLRRKLEPDPANPRYICTERGVGYFFGVPVEAVL